MATIKEVAKLAGVSIGTVSHVISGSVPVSEELRRKVQGAIRTLDYHPNHVARSLKTSRTKTLGIVVPDMTIPFFPKLILGAEAAAKAHGYFFVSVNSYDDMTRQKEVLSLLRSQRVEGILLVVASGSGSRGQITQLTHSGIPVVCLDRLPIGLQIDSVCVNDCAGAEMGVSHLLSKGHKRIAILTGPLSLANEQERLRGYKRALEQARIEPDESLIWEGSLRQEEIIAICEKRLLRMKKRPSALFCTNGVTGMGALRGMAACGITTPNDIAFVTFDELTADDFFRPAITSVVQPAYDIGYRATEVLLNRLMTTHSSTERTELRLPATLKVRESSDFIHSLKEK